MIRNACRMILYGRNTRERRKDPAMKSPKEPNQSSVVKVLTTKDELMLVCRRIADLDALWRINDVTESTAPLKRAA